MDYVGKPLRSVVPLMERNGAPRHPDDKQIRIIRAAVESVIADRDSRVISQLEKVVQRFEYGMSRLMETVEAFKSGEKDVAIANLVDSIEDDLPSVSRLKAAPSAVFTLTTTEIALQLGLKAQDVSFLLKSGPQLGPEEARVVGPGDVQAYQASPMASVLRKGPARGPRRP